MLILILIPNVLSLYHQSTSFLEISEDPSISTSAGSLAAGVHNIDKSISSISSQLSLSLDSLGLKIDQSQLASTSALISLINSEIESKQQSLSTINSEIHFVLRNTDGLYNKCGGARTCEACQYNPLCVWCEIEQICVGGDSDGPFHGECSYFSYQSCYTNGCKSHNRCTDCIGSLTCGWCMNGGSCMDDMGTCDNSLYVHVNVPGSSCPDDITYPDVYVNANPSGSKNSAQVEGERRVIDLRNQSVALVKQIQELELAKAKLIEDTELAGKILIPQVKTADLNEELQEKVDRLARKESKELKAQTDKEIPKEPSVESVNIIESQGTLS